MQSRLMSVFEVNSGGCYTCRSQPRGHPAPSGRGEEGSGHLTWAARKDGLGRSPPDGAAKTQSLAVAPFRPPPLHSGSSRCPASSSSCSLSISSSSCSLSIRSENF